MEKPFDVTYGMLATKGQRFANYFIDGLVTTILAVLALKLNLIFQGNDNITTIESWFPILNNYGFTLYSYAALIIYYGLIESVSGRSLGKFVTGTKVIMRDGSTPEAGAVFLRTICRLIPFEIISFLISPIGWHDSLSKTLVVDIYRYKTAMRQKDEVNDIGKDNIN